MNDSHNRYLPRDFQDTEPLHPCELPDWGRSQLPAKPPVAWGQLAEQALVATWAGLSQRATRATTALLATCGLSRAAARPHNQRRTGMSSSRP
jgi:hypothetical protein